MMEAFCDCGKWMPEGICEACEDKIAVKRTELESAIHDLIDAFDRLVLSVNLDKPSELRMFIDEVVFSVDRLRRMKP